MTANIALGAEKVMGAQYIVAAFLDGTLVVDATGPFRSRNKAAAIAERLNEAAAWTDDLADSATLIAQVVRLRPVSELIEAMSDPSAKPHD